MGNRYTRVAETTRCLQRLSGPSGVTACEDDLLEIVSYCSPRGTHTFSRLRPANWLRPELELSAGGWREWGRRGGGAFRPIFASNAHRKLRRAPSLLPSLNAATTSLLGIVRVLRTTCPLAQQQTRLTVTFPLHPARSRPLRRTSSSVRVCSCVSPTFSRACTKGARCVATTALPRLTAPMGCLSALSQ
jgi:hypothetical protein